MFQGAKITGVGLFQGAKVIGVGLIQGAKMIGVDLIGIGVRNIDPFGSNLEFW